MSQLGTLAGLVLGGQVLRKRLICLLNHAIAVAALACVQGMPAHALDVLDAFYRPDRMLPEWNYFYSGSFKPGDTPPTIPASGALCIYVKNTGTGSVNIDDVTINGQGLANGIRCDTEKLYRCDVNACSVYYPSVRQTLVDAGVPIWWRVDQNPIPVGGTAEVYVRMRTRVLTTLSVAVLSGSSTVATASIAVTNNDIPKIAGYAMSSDMTQVYLYLRHPVKGTLPAQIYIDGVNKTSSCTMCADSDLDIAAVRCSLGSAYSRGSFHTFQAVYADGSKATAGFRVFYDNFKCATWGCPTLSSTAEQRAELIDRGNHSINLFTVGVGDLSDFLKTSEGKSIMDQYGIRYASYFPDSDRVYAYFLCDEPDVGDYSVKTNVAPTVYDRVGTLAQSLWSLAQQKKANYSYIPSMLNVDETFKPANYYIYGQLPDVLSADPYYTQALCDVFWKRPWQIPIFNKAIFVYAHASTANAGCEPRPLHVIMNACRFGDGTKVFRYGTPEEKRIEAYYCLAAGAKQFGYWWLSSDPNSYDGLGRRSDPQAAALWREIGLVNAEACLASPVLVNSCPAQMPISASGRLWVRALVSGTDTLVLICVNDGHVNDQTGTFVRPIADATISVRLPGWLASPTDVFEIDYRGIRDVANTISSGRATLNLGRFDLTRMIIITKDSTLKSALQSSYTSTFAPRVQAIVPMP
jgi:hypothetical protein